MLPWHKKLTGFLSGKGMDIIMVDMDSNHEVLNDLLVEGVCKLPISA